MWTLIFIMLTQSGDWEAIAVRENLSMMDCFKVREALSEDLGKGNGYFNEGSQAICVYMGDNT